MQTAFIFNYSNSPSGPIRRIKKSFRRRKTHPLSGFPDVNEHRSFTKKDTRLLPERSRSRLYPADPPTSVSESETDSHIHIAVIGEIAADRIVITHAEPQVEIAVANRRGSVT